MWNYIKKSKNQLELKSVPARRVRHRKEADTAYVYLELRKTSQLAMEDEEMEAA